MYVIKFARHISLQTNSIPKFHRNWFSSFRKLLARRVHRADLPSVVSVHALCMKNA